MTTAGTAESCEAFQAWTSSYATSFVIYVGMALVFGIISSSATMLTKSNLPAVAPENVDNMNGKDAPAGKVMYMAAGSGIPEYDLSYQPLKCELSLTNIPPQNQNHSFRLRHP